MTMMMMMITLHKLAAKWEVPVFPLLFLIKVGSSRVPTSFFLIKVGNGCNPPCSVFGSTEKNTAGGISLFGSTAHPDLPSRLVCIILRE